MQVESLHLGAYGYLHGHEVGGTTPSLLKAMGCANCCLALNNRFNAENLAGTGLMWEKRPGDLAQKIRWADAHPAEVKELGRQAQDRIREHYTWDGIASQHDAFFRQVARKRGLPV